MYSVAGTSKPNRGEAMKIAIIGATGMIGSRVVAEAASRGHQVTAVSRSGQAADHPNVIPRAADITEPGVAADLAAQQEVIVSAIGPSREASGDPAAFTATLIQLARDLRTTRLVIVGGAGSLLTESGVRLVDTPEFPEVYKAEALAAPRPSRRCGPSMMPASGPTCRPRRSSPPASAAAPTASAATTPSARRSPPRTTPSRSSTRSTTPRTPAAASPSPTDLAGVPFMIEAIE
jgi:NAD(P)-dependent dehydrogenase (short-subunit alcohol dehydrogenase family)